ncbi:MAG: tetratricopeptide repeat protein [Acidimicrobiia bacterium]
MTEPVRAALEAERDQALRDLADLEAQVASEEIDTKTAARLRAVYEAEAADALTGLDALGAAEPGTGRSRARIVGGVGIMALLIAAITFAVIRAIEPRPAGGFATGGLAEEVVREGGTDLAQITDEELEAAVAANPEVVPMRLALARRYVESGEFSQALGHYMTVLEDGPNAEALAYVGWMTYLSGEPETAASLLERSLETEPGHPLALLFLGNVRLYGLGDSAGAIPLLEQLLASDQIPEDTLEQVELMLAEARGAVEGP